MVYLGVWKFSESGSYSEYPENEAKFMLMKVAEAWALSY